MTIISPRLSARAFALLLLLVVPPLVSGTEGVDAGTLFDAANRLYAEGRFNEAASAYEAMLAGGRASAPLYFNLGNAYFKSGQIGRAIAAYRQAEQLSPRDPDLRANLQFARNQVAGPTVRVGFWERRLKTLTLDEWTWLTASAIWLGFGLLALRQVKPTLAGAVKNWALAAGLLSLLALGGLAAAWVNQFKRQTAIITVAEVTIRNAPFAESPAVFSAQDGAELRVLDRKDDWVQVSAGARLIGWIQRESAVVLPES